MAPTNAAYTNHLLATVQQQPFAQGLAAMLPCYWIYWEVGKELTRTGSPNPLYARWIETYGSAEFGAVVGAVRAAADELAARLGEVERAAMRRHFRATSGYEWMFWDMGHRCDRWPFEDPLTGDA